MFINAYNQCAAEKELMLIEDDPICLSVLQYLRGVTANVAEFPYELPPMFSRDFYSKVQSVAQENNVKFCPSADSLTKHLHPFLKTFGKIGVEFDKKRNASGEQYTIKVLRKI